MSANTNWPGKSDQPGRSQRSGKTLTEKMRELGFHLPKKRPSVWATMQHVDVKLEDNRSSNYSVMVPNINLERIIYFQPEVSYDETDPGRHVYKIGKFETDYKGPKEKLRISDIEVISYKPTKGMKFRRKKRQPSITTRIEGILNKDKGALLTQDPSEESIILRPRLQKRKADINDLSESILQKIFLHFTLQERNLLLSRVCKFWYYILKDPIFWTELKFSGENVPKETIIILINKYPSLKKLQLTYVPDAVDILQEMCRCNHSITHLGVRHCSISSTDFARIILHVISCCSNLEILDIKGMQLQSDSFFLELGRLKNLKSINLTGNKLLRNQDLITISLNCRNLRHLKFPDISSDNGHNSLKDEDVTFILSHLERQLETLKMDMQQLRNSSYQAVLKCSNLTCLSLKNCLYLSSEMFRKFPTLKNLKKLKVTRAISIKSDDFQYVFNSESMSRIEHLDINGCWGVGEFGLQAITTKLSFLKSLSLKNCKSIKGHNLSCLQKCPELTNLNVAHTDIKFNYLPTLYQYTKKLECLVIDQKMYRKETIRQLINFFPSLKIIISYSEFQKDEMFIIY